MLRVQQSSNGYLNAGETENLVAVAPSKAECLSSPSLVLKAWEIPGTLTIISHQKTEET